MNPKLFHSFIWLIIVFVFPVWLCGCSTAKTATEPLVLNNNYYTKDSVRVEKHDSIIIQMLNDTVWIKEIHNYYENKQSSDTLFQDVPVPGPTVEIEVIPEWCWWCLGISILLVLLTIGKIAFKIYRKFVLHI